MRILTLLVKVLAGFVVLLLLILLFIRSPWGQGIIKDRAITYLQEKTDTHILLDRIYISFSGNIVLEQLFIEDLKQDTLFYSRYLSVDLPLWPILTDKNIHIEEVRWEGVEANIRRSSGEEFNYQFLLDAFSSSEDVTRETDDIQSSAFEFSLDNLILEDVNVQYIDEEIDLDTRVSIESLLVNMGLTDLERMKFEITKVKLEKSFIVYYLGKPLPPTQDATAVPMPILSIHDAQLSDIILNYHSIPDGLQAHLQIQEFGLNAPMVDLDARTMDVRELKLHNSSIEVEMKEIFHESGKSESNVAETDIRVVWPDWNISFQNIDLNENSISVKEEAAQSLPGQLNPGDIHFSDFIFQGTDFVLTDKETRGKLNLLSFKEKSGIEVERISFAWTADEQMLQLFNMDMNAMNSRIRADLGLEYPSLVDLMELSSEIYFELDISEFDIEANQLTKLLPELTEDPYFLTISTAPLRGHLSTSGSLAKARVEEFLINWGGNTSLFTLGNIYEILHPKQIAVEFPRIILSTTRNDLNHFISEDSLGLRLPDQIRITASMSGGMDAFQSDMELVSDLGRVQMAAHIMDMDSLVLAIETKMIEVQLDSLFQSPDLGSLTLNASAHLSGKDIYDVTGNMEAVVEDFQWKEYPIRDLKLKGDFVHGQGDIYLNYSDTNLQIEVDGYVNLDSTKTLADLNLNIEDANLEALGMVENHTRVGLEFHTRFEGLPSDFALEASVRNGQIITGKNTIPIGNFDIEARVTPDTTDGKLTSRIMDLRLQSNTSPVGLFQAVSSQIQRHLIDSTETDGTNVDPVHVYMAASIRQDPLLREVLLPGLEEMDSIQILVDFKEDEELLQAYLVAPYLKYNSMELDSLLISARSDPDIFASDLSLQGFRGGPVTIHRTQLTNKIEDRILQTQFLSEYQNRALLNFKTETRRSEDSIRIQFDPSVLVFDGNTWHVPVNNQIILSEDKIRFENVNITRGDQIFSIDDNPGQSDLIIHFEKFRIDNLLSYFNPDTLIAAGILDGKITVQEPLGNAGLRADLIVDSFQLMQLDMGLLELSGETEDAQNYAIEMQITGPAIDLDLEGAYHVLEEDAELVLDFRIDTMAMTALEYFSDGTIKNSEGYISGVGAVRGMLSDLTYDGQLLFHQAKTTPVALNTDFVLGSQAIQFNNDGILFQNFTVMDGEENQFVLDGTINTSNLFNPEFNLTMEAENFQVLNSSETENQPYFGSARLDASAHLTGNLEIPVLEVEIEVGQGTHVTYLMPQGQVNLQSREGIVTFVNKNNPDLSNDEESTSQTFTIKGYEINALIKVRNEASFRVIISEATGDHFEISGDGDLDFRIDRSGQLSLTGLYTLQSGHYEMNLYNLVNRRFDIARGSSVYWSGDPFDAEIDIRAIYRIETSPASLMAGQTSSEDISVQNRFRRRLPFLVYLNVDGQLTEPQLSFELDMPEDAQGELGGQVYGQIQRLNQQDQEVNKHVFSLLVLNRFYPSSGSDGSEGGIVNVARDNLNQALADQLNIFSDRLLGDTGFELNFGLDSYTDYEGETPQTRTELDIAAQKNFLNDRLIVQVGSEINLAGLENNSQQENPLIGNVSVEYLITENGQLRLKGFRKNIYANVIDGQTIVSGLALIFTKEFNKFHELWRSNLKEQNLQNASDTD